MFLNIRQLEKKLCNPFLIVVFFLVVSVNFNSVQSTELTPDVLIEEFQRYVPIYLQPPPEVVLAYANHLNQVLDKSKIHLLSPQYIVLVDRNPKIQVALIFFGGTTLEAWQLIGATSVSTGLPGRFDHFLTPLGVFEHSLNNLDFRAEGTKNEFGFRGYGNKGMRVYDFGWVKEPQGWGSKKMAVMRLQMHATDPDLAEHLLGVRRSKGCIRIPSGMNTFIDHFALLDADYDAAIMTGSHFWVMLPDRSPTANPGRYLVVIDSASKVRPNWALPPKRNQKS